VDVEAMSRFFALLAFIAAAGALAVVVGSVARSGPLRRFRDELAPLGLPLAWLVAATCMAGSLYYSEVANYEPCHLCWYQRVAMYPLVVIIGVAALRRDTTVRRYAIPLAALGAVVSIYHIQLERFPDQASFCSVTVPCSLPPVEEFGFVTLAVMALCGFAAIIALLSIARSGSATSADARPAQTSGPDGRAPLSDGSSAPGAPDPAGRSGKPPEKPSDKELVP
jgi:disulfide bond formation protein DsbB